MSWKRGNSQGHHYQLLSVVEPPLIPQLNMWLSLTFGFLLLRSASSRLCLFFYWVFLFLLIWIEGHLRILGLFKVDRYPRTPNMTQWEEDTASMSLESPTMLLTQRVTGKNGFSIMFLLLISTLIALYPIL